MGEALQESEAPRGASTITQQLVKNLWLSPSRNPLRKVKEAILTAPQSKPRCEKKLMSSATRTARFISDEMAAYGVQRMAAFGVRPAARSRSL